MPFPAVSFPPSRFKKTSTSPRASTASSSTTTSSSSIAAPFPGTFSRPPSRAPTADATTTVEATNTITNTFVVPHTPRRSRRVLVPRARTRASSRRFDRRIARPFERTRRADPRRARRPRDARRRRVNSNSSASTRVFAATQPSSHRRADRSSTPTFEKIRLRNAHRCSNRRSPRGSPNARRAHHRRAPAYFFVVFFCPRARRVARLFARRVVSPRPARPYGDRTVALA